MKKIFQTLCILGFILVSLMGSTPVFGENYKSTLPVLTVKDNGNLGVDIHYKFKGAIFSDKIADGAEYQVPHIYGFSHLEEVGSPRVPVRNLHIAVPYGAQPVIQMLTSDFEIQEGTFNIHPSLELAADCVDCPDPKFKKNREVYENNSFFPEEIVKIVNHEGFMGVTTAVLQVRPLQVNPVSGEVKLYTNIKFKVKFEGGDSNFGRYVSNSKHANQMVKNVVLNRGSVPTGGKLASTESMAQLEAGETPKDYIMIVHSNYLAAAEALATWKRQMGYTVEIISQSSWTTTQVKSELQTRYDSWTPKPQYFLIFGDHGDVPAEYTGSRYTDLYYAEMEGSGYKPEMAYGRITPSNATDAQVIVDKIINYEKNPPTLASFYSNVLGCAYYQDDNNDHYADRRFSHTSEDIRNYVMGQGYGVNRVYVTGSTHDPQYYNDGYYSPSNTPIPSELLKPGFPWDGDAADITNYIEAGRFLVYHRDHGDVTLWGDPYFTTSHIGSLNNGELLPVVFSINCLTGQFTSGSECFTEKFLRKSGGGCVGIVGATNLSYSGPNDGFSPGLIDGIWPSPGIDPQYGSGGLGNPIPAHSAIYTMGDLLNFAKNAMEYLWGLHQTTWELFHWYGDPAMKIYTAQPTVTTASHDASIIPGGTTLSITASNCSNGIATLVYENTIKAKITLAGDGTGTLTFDALSGNEPNAILTISKHNFKPYVTNVPVEGGVPPVADFSADQTTVMATSTVQFTDLTINTPSSWSWTFAGGTPSSSTAQNPSVTYNTPGVYDVTLVATNSTGSDTETKVGYITVTTLQPPVADFSASATNISAGDSVTFSDLSSNNPTSWSWTFTGGTPATSTEQNPTVTYNTAGVYAVTLISTNASGSDTETKVDYINVAEKPYCSAQGNNWSYEWIGRVQIGTFDNPSGAAGYTDFTNLFVNLTAGDTVNVTLTPEFSSTTYIEYWKIWIDYNGDHDFEDAGEEVFSGGGTSAVVNGNFTVQSGIDTTTRMRVMMKYNAAPTSSCETFSYGEVEDYTAVISPGTPQPPVADFSASATVINEGDSVTFTDLSTNNPNAWDWTFNGGNPAVSTLQNPTITYDTAGTYSVTLVATNAEGSDTETKVNYITVNAAGTCPGTINNPGFETGDLSNWTTSGNVAVDADAHTGSYAAKLNGSGSTAEQVIIDLCPNTSYTISCWGKGKADANINLGVKDFGGTTQTVAFTDHKAYYQKSITFTTGASNTSATVFVIQNGSKFNGVVDDFTIVKN
jgi:PKD repeat protein